MENLAFFQAMWP